MRLTVPPHGSFRFKVRKLFEIFQVTISPPPQMGHLWKKIIWEEIAYDYNGESEAGRFSHPRHFPYCRDRYTRTVVARGSSACHVVPSEDL